MKVEKVKKYRVKTPVVLKFLRVLLQKGYNLI